MHSLSAPINIEKNMVLKKDSGIKFHFQDTIQAFDFINRKYI
ncbi:hypothetical protein KP78_05260 [Jeotgalibacillus soli]|uniref:Uncharacterized protein n=1 Tax=Jeotgalibacillus soli TaxID=889306 RepID=A0A0C2W6F4_9BACL|nr:hypothetical protein KP78_05260 [Jeotgalibacillus soli]